MELTLIPMRSHERLYSYRQSQQIKANTGCIGYLRVDMDRDGKGFWTAWENECQDRKTTAFKDEFNEVIETLRNDERFGGILKTRLAMYNYCYDHPEAQFDDGRVYGFRVDSEKYAYLLRLTPYPHEYNAYCFCYEREPLDRHLKGAEKGISILGPDYKEKFHIPDGDMIRINREDGSHSDLPCRYVDDSHIEVGYGWDSQFHVCEFADQMDRCNYEVIPLRSTLPDKCYCVTGQYPVHEAMADPALHADSDRDDNCQGRQSSVSTEIPMGTSDPLCDDSGDPACPAGRSAADRYVHRYEAN